jgi:hypothetical protein
MLTEGSRASRDEKLTVIPKAEATFVLTTNFIGPATDGTLYSVHKDSNIARAFDLIFSSIFIAETIVRLSAQKVRAFEMTRFKEIEKLFFVANRLPWWGCRR